MNAVKPRPTKSVSTNAAAKAVTNARAVIQARVPEKKFSDTYISREIVDGMSDMDLFEFADAQNHNVLIYGPTGPGKTSAALAYAAKSEKLFYSISSNAGIEPSQLFGKFVPSPEGIKWVDGPVTNIVRTGGVLLINEINFVPDRVATVLFQLLDKRREITLLDHNGEVIQAHPDLLIIADMNPDYEGTRPLNKALRNRFAVQISWDYDPKVESKLIKSKALLNMATQLRNDLNTEGLETPVSTNMLMEFESFCYEKSVVFATLMFINHFQSDERMIVKRVIDTHKDNLVAELSTEERKKRELQEKKRKAAEDRRRAELEALLDKHRHQKVDWAVHPEDPDQRKFLTIIDEGIRIKTGTPDDDPWGIYGVNWNWGEGDDNLDPINTPLLDEDGSPV